MFPYSILLFSINFLLFFYNFYNFTILFIAFQLKKELILKTYKIVKLNKSNFIPKNVSNFP